MSAKLPIVDLSRSAEEVASTIRDACVKHGFFYVTSHGVPDEVVDGMFAASKEFFDLPEASKRTVLQDANSRGWTPMGEETLDPARQRSGDTKEGYYIGREVAKGSAEADLPLRGPNNWPDEDALGLTAFRAPMQAYYDAACDLARRLLPSFEAALGLEKDFFADKFSRPTALLRPLRYAAAASDPEGGVMAAGAHSDYGVLTLLAVDGTPGLQIQTDAANDEWMAVRHVPGAFVCNVGDLCERWTNGVFKSTVHRVVTGGERERLSCAFFWEPNFDTAVAPLPQCVTASRPAKYPPTTCGEYLLGRYAATHSAFQS